MGFSVHDGIKLCTTVVAAISFYYTFRTFTWYDPSNEETSKVTFTGKFLTTAHALWDACASVLIASFSVSGDAGLLTSADGVL